MIKTATTLALLLIAGVAAAHDMHGARHWHSRTVSDYKPSCQMALFIIIEGDLYDQELVQDAYAKWAECKKRLVRR